MDKSLDEIIGASRKDAVVSKESGNSSRRGRRGGRRRAGAGAASRVESASGTGSRSNRAVCIRNLHSQITEDDLRDLFREVGPVSRTVVDTDDRGKRTGLAWVLYEYGADAAVAAGRYNGRRAAGQVISVRQVSQIGDVGLSLNDRIAGASKARSAKSGPTRSEKRKRGSRGGERKKRDGPKSQDDLDAELDAYMQADEEPSGEPSQQAGGVETQPQAAPEASNSVFNSAAPTEADAQTQTQAAPAQDDYIIE